MKMKTIHTVVNAFDLATADIFVPVARIPDPKTVQEEYELLFEHLTTLNERVNMVEEGLYLLKRLFKVKKTGDDLNRSYQVVFNCSDDTEEDEISAKIYKDFVKSFSLDIKDIKESAKIVTDLVEIQTLKGKPNYCEVDLLGMTERKEPVEC